MTRTLRKALGLAALAIYNVLTAFAVGYDLKVGAGYAYTPWLTTQTLTYSDNKLTEYALAKTQKISSFDTNCDFTLKADNFYANVTFELATFKGSALVQAGYANENLDLSIFTQWSRTAYDSMSHFTVKEDFFIAGLKAYISTDVFTKYVRASAGAFYTHNFVNNISIIANGKLFEVDSKTNSFDVGFDGNIKLFNIFTVGSSIETWQVHNKNGSGKADIVPIQIRNTFYAKADIGFKWFGFYGSLDYFCDHPEISWNKADSINRSNQSYFVLKTGAYFHLGR